VMSRARMQRPIIALALAAKPTDHFSVGLGLHVSYGITANGTAFLQTANNTTSSMRISASIKPQASPNLGWLLTSQKNQDQTGSWSLGQMFRMANSSDVTLAFNSSARAFGSLAALDLRFGGTAAMFYDPLSLETGFTWKHARHARLLLQADFQNWRKFKRPALQIDSQEESCQQEAGGTCDPLLVNPTTLPALALRNIWIARIAEEWTFGSQSLRLGYSYRPSIFQGPPQEAGNYLDPAKHTASIGMGWKFDSFFGWQAPATIDFHANYQALVTQQITKTALNEVGQAGVKIGSPGYTAGGHAWGGGATLNLSL